VTRDESGSGSIGDSRSLLVLLFRAVVLVATMERLFTFEDPSELLGYVLSGCVAVGIWLVMRRYHDMKTRAIKFDYPAPEVCYYFSL